MLDGLRMLREAGARAQLATVLCTRALLEVREGDLDAARASLSEAEALADELGTGPASELTESLARVRTALEEA